jgi:hypothetical protein
MAASVAQRQIELIDQQWRADHVEAATCWDFEDLLRLCVEAFERINRQEEAWRRSVLRGERPYSAEEENEFIVLCGKWTEVCGKFLPPLAGFERRGFQIESAGQFRSCIREAEGILTPDAKFFVADALVRMRDAAIEEHRRGEAEHVGGQG